MKDKRTNYDRAREAVLIAETEGKIFVPSRVQDRERVLDSMTRLMMLVLGLNEENP